MQEHFTVCVRIVATLKEATELTNKISDVADNTILWLDADTVLIDSKGKEVN
jgi:hypothetical protein